MVKPTKTKLRQLQQQQLLQLSLFLLRILPSFSSSEPGPVAAASSSSCSSSSTATGGGSRYCKYPPSPARSSRNNRLNRSQSRSCEILTTPKLPKSNRTPQPPRRKMNLLAVASPSAKSQSTADLRTVTERPESTPSPYERANWWTEWSTMLSKAGTMWHKVNRNWFRRTSTSPKQERYL